MYNNEKKLDKNYFLALALSMLVLVGYSFFLQYYKTQQPAAPQTKLLPNQNQNAAIVNAAKEIPAALSDAAQTTKAVLDKLSPITKTQYQNRQYDVELSSLGGTVTRLVFKGEKKQSGILNASFYQSLSGERGALGVKILNDGADLTNTPFQLNPVAGRSGAYEFVYEKPGEYKIIKRFFFGEKEPLIGMDIFLQNLSSHQERSFPLSLLYAMNFEEKNEQEKASVEAVVKTQKLLDANHGKLSKKGWSVSEDIVWSGIIKKYFAFLVKPEGKIIRQEAKANADTVETEIFLEPFSLAPGASIEKKIFIYAGPQRYEVLSSFDSQFEDVLSRGVFGAFKILLLKSLKFFNQYCHNFGWAIIILTLVIKGLFLPLTQMSFKSMSKMQAIQPKLKSLQERHKKDPAKLNKEMMELYKKHKVNPLGGCLPMLLQIPIFIAFYQMLNDAIELKGTPFIGWVKDLAEPDRLFMLPMSLPFIGESFNLLPLLMAASMVIQQKMTPQMSVSPEQAKMMNIMMPVMFGFMFYNMPAGLVLYWLMNNTFSIIHQGLVKKMIVIPQHDDEDGK